MSTRPDDRPDTPLTSRRIYHVTHLRNLESIFFDEAIRAGAPHEFDLLTPAARESRAAAEVFPGESVDAFVPFSLSPDAGWWSALRSGRGDDQWSPAARTTPGTQYVMLVGTVAAVGSDIALSDGDSAASATRFGVGREAAGSLARRISFTDPDLIEAELLVRGSYPMKNVVLLAVPNEPVRDQVRAMLREHGGVMPKVVVYPPWFQPTDDE